MKKQLEHDMDTLILPLASRENVQELLLFYGGIVWGLL